MRRDPEIGDGGIPRARDGGQGREENAVDQESGNVADGEGYRKEEDVRDVEGEEGVGVDRECCGK